MSIVCSPGERTDRCCDVRLVGCEIDEAAVASIGDVEELFRLLSESKGGWNRRLAPLLTESFHARVGVVGPDGEVSLLDVVTGVGAAVSWHNLGLLLDWQEARLLQATCWDLVETMVGLPDDYWFEPEKYTKFEWSGTDVADGLAAFDRWLVEENTEFRGEVPCRLVNVDTGSDFYVALLCEGNESEVIAQLQVIGLKGELLNS